MEITKIGTLTQADKLLTSKFSLLPSLSGVEQLLTKL